MYDVYDAGGDYCEYDVYGCGGGDDGEESDYGDDDTYVTGVYASLYGAVMSMMMLMMVMMRMLVMRMMNMVRMMVMLVVIVTRKRWW